MLVEHRKRHLLTIVARDGQIFAKQAAQDLGVSEDTIRRDLRELAAEGRLRRVHGGALPASLAEGSLSDRSAIAITDKVAIGRLAASMIQPGQIVFVDGGTTAMQLVAHLDRAMPLTLITHSPLVAGALAGHAAEVRLVGGNIFKHSMVSIGASALREIREVRPHIFFMGVTGVHPDTGLTTGNAEEAAIKREIAGMSGEVVVMASSEKIGAVSPFLILPVASADVLLVTRGSSAQVLASFTASGLQVRQAI